LFRWCEKKHDSLSQHFHLVLQFPAVSWHIFLYTFCRVISVSLSLLLSLMQRVNAVLSQSSYYRQGVPGKWKPTHGKQLSFTHNRLDMYAHVQPTVETIIRVT